MRARGARWLRAARWRGRALRTGCRRVVGADHWGVCAAVDRLTGGRLALPHVGRASLGGRTCRPARGLAISGMAVTRVRAGSRSRTAPVVTRVRARPMAGTGAGTETGETRVRAGHGAGVAVAARTGSGVGSGRRAGTAVAGVWGGCAGRAGGRLGGLLVLAKCLWLRVRGAAVASGAVAGSAGQAVPGALGRAVVAGRGRRAVIGGNPWTAGWAVTGSLLGGGGGTVRGSRPGTPAGAIARGHACRGRRAGSGGNPRGSRGAVA
jgi:hypothetical protein